MSVGAIVCCHNKVLRLALNRWPLCGLIRGLWGCDDYYNSVAAGRAIKSRFQTVCCLPLKIHISTAHLKFKANAPAAHRHFYLSPTFPFLSFFASISRVLFFGHWLCIMKCSAGIGIRQKKSLVRQRRLRRRRPDETVRRRLRRRMYNLIFVTFHLVVLLSTGSGRSGRHSHRLALCTDSGGSSRQVHNKNTRPGTNNNLGVCSILQRVTDLHCLRFAPERNLAAVASTWPQPTGRARWDGFGFKGRVSGWSLLAYRFHTADGGGWLRLPRRCQWGADK